MNLVMNLLVNERSESETKQNSKIYLELKNEIQMHASLHIFKKFMNQINQKQRSC